MRKKLQILESDLAKFSALLRLPFFSTRVRPSTKKLPTRCSPRQRARRRYKSTRGATESSRAKFHMIWPLGVLNRGTERPESEEERTPSSSNRARRRTKLEVHGGARTRPVSERLRKRQETPSRTVLDPLLSPFKASSGVRTRWTGTERHGESRFRQVRALCRALRTIFGSRCMQGMWNKHVSWIYDLKSVANGGERPVSTQKWAPARVDGGGHEDA
jgi:hypothetical protein